VDELRRIATEAVELSLSLTTAKTKPKV
jgi:hypothetical protein